MNVRKNAESVKDLTRKAFVCLITTSYVTTVTNVHQMTVVKEEYAGVKGIRAQPILIVLDQEDSPKHIRVFSQKFEQGF